MTTAENLRVRAHHVLAQCYEDLMVSFLGPVRAPDRSASEIFRDPDAERRGLVRPGLHMMVGPDDERDVKAIHWGGDGVTFAFVGGTTLAVDLRDAPPDDVVFAGLVTELMNFDGRIELTGVDASAEARRDFLLERLDSDSPFIVRAALAEAQHARESIADALLEHLTDMTPEEVEDSSVPSLALYLFAAWRDPRPLKPLLEFLERFGEEGVEAFGSVITQDLSPMLRAWDGPELSATRSLIESEPTAAHARMAAIGALVDAAVVGQIEVDVVEEWLLQFAERRLSGTSDDTSTILSDAIALATADLGSERLRPWVERAFENDWIDESMVAPEEVWIEVRRGRAAAMARARKRVYSIDDVVDATSWWNLFSESYLRDRDEDVDALDEDSVREANGPGHDAGPEWQPVETIRTGPKVGRNDPCPCGSGKKYKKCCGA